MIIPSHPHFNSLLVDPSFHGKGFSIFKIKEKHKKMREHDKHPDELIMSSSNAVNGNALHV